MNDQMIFWMIAAEGVVTVFGVGRKLYTWSRKRRGDGEVARVEGAMSSGRVAASAQVRLPAGVGEDTPFARFVARETGSLPDAFAAEAEPAYDEATPELAPAPERKGLLDFVFLSRLTLAMLFVGALAYDPKAALGLVKLLLPLIAVLAVLIVVRRALAGRRASGVA